MWSTTECLKWEQVRSWYTVVLHYLGMFFWGPAQLPQQNDHRRMVGPPGLKIPQQRMRFAAGSWLGTLMPVMLSGYELGNLVIVQRTFLAEFVTEKPVRRKYLMSNQATCPGFFQIFLEFPLFPSSVEENCLHFLFNWPNRASSNRLSWFRRRSASFIAWQRVPE